MYQALYRKWRPRVFADVVGQSHITRTLRTQVAQNRTSHAYLFTGTRGTGKTTCAKILSRAVNCEQPDNGDPCGKCSACIGLESGKFLDVLELDAASNNGVDQVRALRDEAVYSPANVRKRVYIVDEVHMLSTAAFNALLKILEEPPEHLMFILATTEVHKVPATILSRCQRYAFRRIQPQDIAARLEYVAQQEHMDLTPDGAQLLARLADGALRDGLSLLDQCAAQGRTIDTALVLDTLGLAGRTQTVQLMENILRRDAQAALILFGKLYANGKDPGAVLGELSGLVRDLLLWRIAPEGGAALRSYDDALLARLGQGTESNRLLYLAETLQSSGTALNRSPDRRLEGELCLLRLCDETLSGDLTALSARVERLESAVSSGQRDMPPQYAHEALPQTPYAYEPPPRIPYESGPRTPYEPVTQAPYAYESAQELPWQESAPQISDQPLPELPYEQSVPETAYEPYPPPEVIPEQPQTPDKSGVGTDTGQNSVTNTGKAAAQIPDKAAQIPDKAAQSPEPAVPAGMSGGFHWQNIADRCRKRLPIFYGAFLNNCTGVMEGNVLVVYVTDHSTMTRLNNDRVRGAMLEESGAVRVDMREGDPPQLSPEENLQQLVEFSSHQGIIAIHGKLS